MASNKSNCFRVILASYLIVATELYQTMAVRTLEGELWMAGGLVFNALPKGGPARSSKSSPCTYIPNKGRGRCAMELHDLKDVAYVDHASALPTFPDVVGKFGSAMDKIINQTQRKQDSSS